MRRFVAVAWPRAAAAGAATARRACPGPAAVHVVCGSTQRHRATTAHALVEEYVTRVSGVGGCDRVVVCETELQEQTFGWERQPAIVQRGLQHLDCCI